MGVSTFDYLITTVKIFIEIAVVLFCFVLFVLLSRRPLVETKVSTTWCYLSIANYDENKDEIMIFTIH